MDRDLEFLFEIGALRFKQRAWSQFLTKDFANITEHTFRVMWICLILATREGYKDTGHLVKLALAHDLAESRGVDVHYVSREFATRHEHAAVSATFSKTSLEKEFLELIAEAEAKKTMAAKILKDADNLDIDLELKEQEAIGNQLRKAKAETRRNVYQNKFFTESAKRFWEEIQTANPFDWLIKPTESNMRKRDYAKE